MPTFIAVPKLKANWSLNKVISCVLNVSGMVPGIFMPVEPIPPDCKPFTICVRMLSDITGILVRARETLLDSWFCKTAPRTERPSTVPIWRVVDRIPAPMPDCSTGVLAITTVVVGAITRPIPTPLTANGSTRFVQLVTPGEVGHQVDAQGRYESPGE